MPRVVAALSALAVVMLSGLTDSASAQAPVPIPEPRMTLGRFLGIPQALGGAYDAVANRRGNLPGLERRGRGARVRRIADPAFFHPDAPPLLKTAAQIKMQEDLAPQKIKALKYLGSIGCGCYDKDGEVTAALLEGLNDCTLEVRMAAVEVIGETAGQYCDFCNERSCCKPALAEKLDEMANGQDDKGCWLEPSAEVRAAAARALSVCGPIIVDVEPVRADELNGGPEDLPETPPVNGDAPQTPVPLTWDPPKLTAPANASRTPIRSSRRGSPEANTARNQRRPAHATPVASANLAMATDGTEDLFNLFQSNTTVKSTSATHPTSTVGAQPVSSRSMTRGSGAADASRARGNHADSPSRPVHGGVVESVDRTNGVVQVRFKHSGDVPPGTPVSIVHRTLIGGLTVSGQVIRWQSGQAVVRPFDSHVIGRLARGDEATLYIPRPKVYR